MESFRRHLNFKSKSPLNQIDFKMTTTLQINACNLMNNIQRCVDVCPTYIQALNSLCGAGSLLARNLCQTFQNIPTYEPVAQQFLCVWDEISKATGTASAAVKTDTLIKLQNALETLEAGTCDSSADVNLVDSFQVIGSCLFSFVELQAQFSFSMWKSLSKLSKTFSHDTFINPLHWKSHDRNTLKLSKNSELSSTIKKHFSQLVHKYDSQKPYDQLNNNPSQFYLFPANLKEYNISNNQTEVQNVSNKNTANTVVWSPATTLWSTTVESENKVPSTVTQQKASASPRVCDGNDLDQVINLLSCMPIGQFLSQDMALPSNQKSLDIPFQSSSHFWAPGSAPVLSRHMKSQRSWPDDPRGVSFGNNPWIWRNDNFNCSSLPSREFEDIKDLCTLRSNKSQNSWNQDLNRSSIGTENESSSDDVCSSQGQDFQKFNNFIVPSATYYPFRHRRHSSSDKLPDSQDYVSGFEDYPWNFHSQKTSTWPLKQSNSKL